MSRKTNLQLIVNKLYMQLVKKESNKYSQPSKTDRSGTYITMLIILFLLLLAGDIFLSSNGYFTVQGLQLTFLIIVVFTLIFFAYSYFSTYKLSSTLIIKAIIVNGILLRVCYTLFTSAGTRTYDVYRDKWGHLDYINYIAQNFSLPPVNECQTYHPPVHHIISAFVLDISRLFTREEFYQLKAIQLTMVLLSSITLVFFYKILKELNCNNTVLLTAVSFFAFHPTNIYFSSRINNDNTMLFFYTLALYFLIKWVKSKSMRDIVFLSFTAALAILTKLSGIMLIPIIALSFAIMLVKYRNMFILLFKQYAVFGLIYIPLSVSYQIRNLVLFGQPFGYIPSVGKGFTPTLYNLVFVPINNFLKNPFNNGGLTGGEFFTEFFIKSSLFGEWQYPALKRLAIYMLILIFVIILIIFVYLVSAKKELLGKHKYIFLLNLIIPVLLEMKLRTDLPVACSQDFRYSAPILISASLFLGEAVTRLNISKLKFLKYPVIFCVSLFCVFSTVFVLLLGYYS